MLNELYTLERSLKRFSVDVEESHPSVKRLGRANLLIAGLDASGLATRIEQIDKQGAVTLFKIQESNHSNFPQVNWTAPIWSLDRESSAVQEWLACPAEAVKRRIELLRKVCDIAPVTAGQNRLLSRMREFCGELAPRFVAAEESEFTAFPILIERLLGMTVPADEWLRCLSNSALSGAEGGGSPDMLAAVETLLAGKFDKKANRFQEAKVPILFDLADCTKFRCRVANSRMGGYFSRRLNATEATGIQVGRCALTGVDMPIEMDKMPSPRLPVIGDTVLMSMNPDTPCQTRYGRTGTSIFPLGKKTATDLNTALIHLTTPDRQHKNWKRIPGATRKKFNLLVVYLQSSPLFDADIAEMFSGPDESDALYTTICTSVCDALRGREAQDSDLLQLFVLNKIDPGRVQVELSEAFTAEQVIRGGEAWKRGASNRPALLLEGDDFVPSPADVVRCLQMMWERGGSDYSEVPGCRLADVYDVLIDGRQRAEVSAAILLRMALRRIVDLPTAVGHAVHRGGKDAWKNISRDAAKNPVIAASLFSITLSKLGHRKETYMQEPAFLVGRFLSLADTLHAEYCKDVRKNDMPPQLLGNALIPTAISDPNKGLARMLQRVRVYQAWARGKKGTGLARWSCGEMGKIANTVAGKLSGRRLNDAEQAQLLLGYLARAESNQEKVSEEGAEQ